MARLDDGFNTRLWLSENPDLKVWEKEITLPSLIGGGANRTTTMRNTRVHTKAPKQLLDVGDVAMVCAYDPAAYDELLLMMQVNQESAIQWPDGFAEVVWGWVDEFTPSALTTEGEQPEADVVFIVSNQDGDGDEVLPVYKVDGWPIV